MGAFDGKVAFVTGAARGIGRATAKQLACSGASVALFDRDRAEVEAAARSLEDQAAHTLALTGDVSSREDVDRAVDHCLAELGALDVLVSNAGIHFARAIDEYSDEEWARVLSVNLTGTFYVIRAALPALRRAKGSIVCVSSMTALVGQSHGAAYVAKALALELAPDGVRVNCVCPAGVDTPLMRSWAATTADPEGVLRGQAAMHLTNRLASPQEIARAICFLASPEASFITGVALPVEGGATLGYRRT
jgi:NAD(P)-dependent dehydrogenase (short-subunit alcohol dehydrogenase family)